MAHQDVFNEAAAALGLTPAEGERLPKYSHVAWKFPEWMEARYPDLLYNVRRRGVNADGDAVLQLHIRGGGEARFTTTITCTPD